MNGFFQVYLTPKGLKQVSNPLRQRILLELQKRELSLSDISDITGKAQSTISGHLEELVKDDLISFKDDPTDSRRKVYFLISKPIGSSAEPREDLKLAIGNTIAGSIGLPSSFLKGVIRSIIIGMESIGLRMEPMLRDIGRLIGAEISKRIKSSTLDGVIKEIKIFYEQHELGEVCVYSVRPLILIIRDEYNCHRMPETGRSFCILNEGIIGGILESCMGMRLSIIMDAECLASGYSHCKYYVEPMTKSVT
ncbi:MAG: ArsR family transcriptional regulator [Methanomassiliicoccales archaeon]